MRKYFWIFCLIFVLLLASCKKEVVNPGESPLPVQPDISKIGITSEKGWETEWEQLVQAARKEGKIVIGSSGGQETRDAISGPLKRKFGLDMEWLTSPSNALIAKISTERRAGLFLWDILITGPDTPDDVLRPSKTIVPLDNLLLLPEVKDPKAWYGGKLLFYDVDNTILTMTATPTGHLTVNTQLVLPSEIKSLLDLLNPKWKGKIVMHSPIGGGSGRRWANIHADIMGFDFLKELAKQEPVLSNDHRLLAEWLARGKYGIGIAIRTEDSGQFIAVGAPLARIVPAEGGYLASSGGNIMVFDRAPHPNASKVFLNWLLSREGQIVWSKGSTDHTARVDIKAEELEIPAQNIRKPGEKYLFTLTREFRSTKYAKEITEIFAPLTR